MSTLRGGPGLGALLTLARHAAGAPPAVLRRGGIATAIGLAAQRSPDRPVLVREHDTLTGRELDSALRAIASEAIRHKAGARGLRAILERAMLEVMYEVPSNKQIKEVVVSEETILKGEKPLIVLEKRAETA